MNLKEAFRYQNKLQSFMDEAQEILDRDSNVTKVENTYLRHKVMAEADSWCTCSARRRLFSLQSERQRMRWTSTWTVRSASMPPDRALPAHLSG